MKVVLLGVGMQGKAALHDLMQSEKVTDVIAADRELEALKAYVESREYGDRVTCEYLNAEDPVSINQLMEQKPDAVIDLLPERFCSAIAASAIKHRIHLVNTFQSRPIEKKLADEAKASNVTILPDFGLDPGIDLVLLGEAVRSFDSVEEIISYGSGIPELQAADNPIRYKVTWTFEGVLDAYHRPARLIRHGEVVDIKGTEIFYPQNIHEIEIQGLGNLEAYPNGDALKYVDLLGIEMPGLRTMGCYTLRWPGHCVFWRKLVDLHLLDTEPVVVDNVSVDRKRFLTAVIEPHIQLGCHERDVVVVRIEVEGTIGESKKRAVYQLIDRRDLETGFSAMSRTVGFTASIGAQMIGTGQITKHGVISPARDVPYGLLLQELRKRDIVITSDLMVST
ncbi:MAG: hypothetical protein AMJ91_05255 [candidate division Zixibacteria bacterium SM23_73_3]|nr:MAG: hypothetical protein AMJ91_05255 [candidate division Zixibacteria bacterium SM23_73_3]